jgi:hypothetical protein
LATSQASVSNLFLPIGSNWNEHLALTNWTCTGARACAAASAGLAAMVSMPNSGK